MDFYSNIFYIFNLVKMSVINDKIKPIDQYLIEISKNTVTDLFELKIGIPYSWEYKSNKKIDCEVLLENEENNGKILKIFPLDDKIIIDDLIDYAVVIVNTNAKIVEMQEKFNKEIEKTKITLEGKIKEFMGDIDDYKKNAFENLFENKSTKKIENKKIDTNESNNSEIVTDKLSS